MRLKVATRLAFGIVVVAAMCGQARGDGGVLQTSQLRGEVQVSVFTSPAVLRCGPIDISVLAQDAKTKKVCDDLAISVGMEAVDGKAIPMRERATFEAATNRMFKAAQFEAPKEGRWRVTVSFPEAGLEPIGFEVEVGPPLPQWVELAPWVGWPFLVAGLFLVHQRLAERRGRGSRRLVS